MEVKENSNLSSKIIPEGQYKEDDNVILGSPMLWAKDVKHHIKNILEKTRLNYPIGCNKNLGRGLCGEISFSNKIILCDDCVKMLIDKLEENQERIKQEIGDKLL